MVIRRIREHVAAHNWFAVGIDLAIVVAGVFLGIQVNNWNEARIQAAQAREYRTRLIGEIDFNRQQYGHQLAYYRKAREHGLAALERLTDARQPRDADFLLDLYQATQLDISPAKRFIYDEMVSAGMVARLGNPRAQELASDLYLGVAGSELSLFNAPPYRDVIRRAMPYPIQQQIRAQCGDRVIAVDGRVIGIALPDDCKLDIPPDLAAAGVAQVAGQPGIELDLIRNLAALDQKIGILRLNIRQTDDLLAALRAS